MYLNLTQNNIVQRSRAVLRGMQDFRSDIINCNINHNNTAITVSLLLVYCVMDSGWSATKKDKPKETRCSRCRSMGIKPNK